jgi:hypothetical protein
MVTMRWFCNMGGLELVIGNHGVVKVLCCVPGDDGLKNGCAICLDNLLSFLWCERRVNYCSIFSSLSVEGPQSSR